MHDLATLHLRNATRIVLGPFETCITGRHVAHAACESIMLFVSAQAQDRPILTYVRTTDEQVPKGVVRRMLSVPDQGASITDERNRELWLGRVYAIRFGDAGPLYVQRVYASTPHAVVHSPLAPWNDCL